MPANNNKNTAAPKADLVKLVARISSRLEGMNYDDLTVAERQIAKLLIDDGFMTRNKNYDLESVIDMDGNSL